MGWNIRSWQKVDWSDVSRFLLNPVDGRCVRVLRPRNTAFQQEHIVGTTAVVWRIVSSGRFIGLIAQNHALLRCMLTVRLLMHPLTINRLRSVFRNGVL
jgi:hypothetical protein